MADKGKKPFVSPVGAKNVAAAKAAFGGPTAAKDAPAAQAKNEPAGKATANGEKKENAPVVDPKAKAAAVPAGKGAPAAKEPVKEEPPAPAPAPPKPQHTAKPQRKPADSDESSEVSSDEEDSDYSDSESESERAKAKKIDVGVSLSAIKAAFQQDNQARQQIKKGYDAEEFKRGVKEATAATQECVAAENEPEAQSSDVVRGAVQSDLGLDVVKSANIRNTKNRFEQGLVNDHDKHEENDELKELKNRSAVSGANSKWENPEDLSNVGSKETDKTDIEVGACKARKMKEKFERKVKKEEKKAKSSKPKKSEPHNTAAADRPYLQRSSDMTDRVVAQLELVEMKRTIYK